MRVRQDPEFWPEKAEFWLEPEFWVNLSFAPNAQKKAWSSMYGMVVINGYPYFYKCYEVNFFTIIVN